MIAGNSFKKIVITFFLSGMMTGVSANSVTLAMDEYSISSGFVSVTVNFDFTEFPMFGGSFDLFYDPTALEFVSFTQAALVFDAQAAASPVGNLQEPGWYAGAGIGTFDFFNGMNSAGEIGTFVFNILDPSGGQAECGLTLCLAPNPTNPFVSLAGYDVTDDILSPGLEYPVPIPVPAAILFFISGLGALLGIGRKAR